MNSIPGSTWQMLDQKIAVDPFPKGLDAIWDAGIGLADRIIPRQKKLLNQAQAILEMEDQFSDLSDDDLQQAVYDMREIFRCNRDDHDHLQRAYALIREVAYRQLGMKPYLVQVAGALALNAGYIAEMATGEGKTLTATMPATIAGWRGGGCHVLTSNDYLAKRDVEIMQPIYQFCGLTAASIEQQTPPEERKQAYLADITYCTNKEVAADFLRDRLILGKSKGLSSTLIEKIGSGKDLIDGVVQRGLNYAIIDEADSILIDEAVTPLIISGDGPNPQQAEVFKKAAKISKQLRSQVDYTIDIQYREIEMTEQGKVTLAEIFEYEGGILGSGHRRMEFIERSLMAKEFYIKNKHYVIDDDKIVIVDEFTGRLMPDRTWRDGLHQAVEAKENLEINPPKDTFARVSFQRFFRSYRRLSGMTGTAMEATNEFWQIYHLPVVTIPTNRPCQRKDLPSIVMPNEKAKWARIVNEVCKVHKTGRPILIGTGNVHSSEYLSQLLSKERLKHQVLNAVYLKQEAQIVACAGQYGNITVATNMAGRGTDIKLGTGVADLGGLHVISAEPNESARIDRQLYGRCARQGDPGSTQGIFSLDDQVVSRYAKQTSSYIRKKYADSDDEIKSDFLRGIIRYSQKNAEKAALSQRKNVLNTDYWLDQQLGFAGSN